MGFLDDIVNKETASKHIEQGSEAWDNIRCGRFTASEIYLLMESGTRDMTPEELKARPKSGKGSAAKKIADHSVISEKAWSYIHRKVAETLTGRIQDSSYAFPLVYGKETEADAVAHFENVTGIETFEVGFQPFGDYAGGSPDRFTSDNGGLEVKCPYTSEKQIDYLMLTDVWDLKRCFPQIYWQCMSNMLFADKERWHLITYDPRFTLDKLKMTHVVLLPDAEAYDLITTKLGVAIQEMLKLLNILRK